MGEARQAKMPPPAPKKPAGSNPTGKSKKKKWSKGKVKDKANNAVVLDKTTYDRVMKEVPTFRMISQSILIDRMKVNGSIARMIIRELEKQGSIKRIVHSRAQLVYTRATAEAYFDRHDSACNFMT